MKWIEGRQIRKRKPDKEEMWRKNKMTSKGRVCTVSKDNVTCIYNKEERHTYAC